MAHPLHRRSLFGALGASLAFPAIAQDSYPTRPIRIINPWPAGGPADLIIRPMAAKLQEAMGQPVIVEGRPGANGTIGAQAVAQAAPDGYTLYFAHIGALAISPGVQRISYDPIRSFTPITLILTLGSLLCTRATLPVTTTQEFIDYARARPGQVNLGSIGIGSTAHLFGELFQQRAEVQFTHVPFQGAAPVVTEMLAGRIDASFLGVPAVSTHMAAGTIRGISISSARPPRSMPNLPTINQVLPGFETETWYGMLGPAGLPPAITQRLNRELVSIIRSPEISDLFVRDTYEPVGSTPEEFAARIQRDLTLYTGLARRAGLQPS